LDVAQIKRRYRRNAWFYDWVIARLPPDEAGRLIHAISGGFIPWEK
jgi:hypothetical protein